MSNQHNTSYIENTFPIKKISQLAIKEGNSKKPIYQLHKWWARRLSSIVRGLIIGCTLSYKDKEEDFWNRFYNKNQLDKLTVMDIFMGGGSSLVEAKKMGAKTIGVDIDPLACFITKQELEKINFDELKFEFKRIEKKIATQIKNYYTTKIENNNYPVINYFWVYNVNCPNCDTNFDAHPHYQIYTLNKEQGVICKSCGKLEVIDKNRKILQCSSCNKRTTILKGTFKRGKCECPSCKHNFSLKNNIQATKNLKLFALEYEKEGKRFYKETTPQDVALYEYVEKEFELYKKDLEIPQTKISIENNNDKRPISHGYKLYKDLFNSRQLFSLGLILKEIINVENENIRNWLILTFSDSLAANNMLCSYAFGYRKLTPLFGIHAYTVPARPVENNVWGTNGLGRGSFQKTFNKMIKSKQYCQNTYEIKLDNNQTKKIYTKEFIQSKVTHKAEEFYNNEADSLILNQSSEELNNIKDNSVNLILTDPPYYDNLHYSHLADFYYQWIKNFIYTNNTNQTKNSLFAQNDSKETYEIFKNRLTNIFSECYKKLNDDGLMIFSYHHNKENAWKAIGESLKNNNFYISNIFPIRSEGQSAYHSSEQTIKWDSIIVVRKKMKHHTKLDLETLINNWEEKIFQQKLDLKPSDKLSFYRSLGVMSYCSNIEANIEDIFKIINSYQFA
ncbi:DNA methyltransferase [Aliarcobacter butzleri]